MLLEIRNLKKSYFQGKRKIEVLKGINLTLEEGKFYSLMGPSGSGKTSLLNLISLLDFPEEGEIIFKGKNILNFSEKEKDEFRKNQIGIIFQFFNLLPEFTALENVAFSLLLKGISRKEAFSKSRELLEKFGLKERENFYPSDLSGGEQQRIAVLRALVKSPSFLLADEPTGNLDLENSLLFFEFLREVSQKEKITIFLSSHDLNLREFAEKIFYLENGVIKEKDL